MHFSKKTKYILIAAILLISGGLLALAGGSSAGPIGTVLDFDGVNDYLSASDNSVLDQTNAFSFSVWVKPDVVSTADEYIIYRQDSYYIKKTAPDIIIGGIWYDSSWHTVTSTEIRSVPSKWTHMELTYDKNAGGTDELKLYLNGILTGKGDNSTAIPAAATKLYIGAGDEIGKDNTPENFFDGKIGDLKFYQYARSADEVRVDYNAGFSTLLAPVGKNCSVDPASCMDYGLVGYWNLDEGGGQMVRDLSNSGNNGVLGNSSSVGSNDPLWIKGKKGNALKFDGKDDYVTAPDNASISGLRAVTVSAWMYATAWGGENSYFYIVAKSNWTENREYRFRLEQGSNMIWEISNDGAPPAVRNFIPISGNLSLNTWYHIVGTFDTDNSNLLKLYINGILRDTDTGETGPIFDGIANFSIGSSGNDGDDGSYPDNFYGLVDDVRIYNRALSAEEVRYHYNRGGPVAEWKFDEGSGTVAKDSTEKNNDGTLNSFASPPTATSGWASGKYGSALVFDGTGDYVSRAYDADFNFGTGSFTIGGWFKHNTIATSSDYLLSRYDADQGFKVWMDDSGDMCFGIDDDATWDTDDSACTSGIDYDDNLWHYLSAYKNGTTGIYLYIDGILVASDTSLIDTLTLTSDSASLYIGSDGPTPGSYWEGALDDIRIYNYARSQDQILQDYNGGVGTHF